MFPFRQVGKRMTDILYKRYQIAFRKLQPELMFLHLSEIQQLVHQV